MTRVAHVISTRGFVGGAERVMLALLEVGRRRGWDLLVLNPFAVSPGDSPIERAVGTGYRPISGARTWDLPRLRREVDRSLREFAPDLVHAHMFHAAALVASLPRRQPRLLSHQYGALYRQQGRWLEAAVDWWAMTRYDRVVACSADVAAYLVRQHPRLPVSVVHNGWEGSPRARRPSDRPTVVCVANLRREKGHATLLAAWPEVRRAVPEATLRLVGDGPLRGSLEKMVGAQEGVVLVGAVDDVWAELARADVFVLPTRHEPFGIVVAEAMAAGLPVVVTDVGGVPEFVDDGQQGALVPPDDPSALAAALVDRLRDPERARREGEAGRLRAADFHVDRSVQQYLDVYRELGVVS